MKIFYLDPGDNYMLVHLCQNLSHYTLQKPAKLYPNKVYLKVFPSMCRPGKFKLVPEGSMSLVTRYQGSTNALLSSRRVRETN